MSGRIVAQYSLLMTLQVTIKLYRVCYGGKENNKLGLYMQIINMNKVNKVSKIKITN